MTDDPVSDFLHLNPDLTDPLESLVRWCATDPRPAAWLLEGPTDLPADIKAKAEALLSAVPDIYFQRARHRQDLRLSLSADRPWNALGLLVEDATCLKFRRVLLGIERNPLETVFHEANVFPDSEGLIKSSLLGPDPRGLVLGNFDVEMCRSTPATNSTYWLAPFIHDRSSAGVRLDPFRWARNGDLARAFYAMVVYGPPFDWERVLRLKAVEASQWIADSGGPVNPELITELVWKPRGDEIILEVEQLPSSSQVAFQGARYLHAVLRRRERRFVHLDGAIRWYTDEELTHRRGSRLDRAGAVGQRTKIFRIDEALKRDEALSIVAAFFVWNYDLVSYFDPGSANARLSRGKRRDAS